MEINVEFTGWFDRDKDASQQLPQELKIMYNISGTQFFSAVLHEFDHRCPVIKVLS